MVCLSSDNEDNSEIGEKRVIDGDLVEYRKIWLIEWPNKSGKTLSEERYDYNEALTIFNEKLSNGVDAILYEVQKALTDSSVIKKTPVLNSVKARQRRKDDLEKPKREDQVSGKENRNNKSGSIRYRIILLIAVIAVLVLVISLFNAID